LKDLATVAFEKVSFPLRLVFGFLTTVAMFNAFQIVDPADHLPLALARGAWVLTAMLIFVCGYRHAAWVSRTAVALFVAAALVFETVVISVGRPLTDAPWGFWFYIGLGVLVCGALLHHSVRQFFDSKRE
jgi:hypothetical protein